MTEIKLQSKQWTDEELEQRLEEIRLTRPELFQFISDFIEQVLTLEDIEKFLELSDKEKRQYIKNHLAKRGVTCRTN
ncbi:hypothetical protein AB6M97_07910 [Streptococcus hillyeri]|uniref:Uncharacterized protein n=1 Tax=Streptococcus hillyeri TaxID=2282420 RepID=A0A3L9DSB0_9STRE|nr:hypothetical protein [Streptococcus hillyeri]RLY02913.1 hypothetical protein EAF07_06365 [Streptococcus hillyeri]